MHISIYISILPKSCVIHGKTIVSPITALYDCPLDINFGADAELSYSKV